MSEVNLNNTEIEFLLNQLKTQLEASLNKDFTVEERVQHPDYAWAYYLGSQENPKRLFIASNEPAVMHRIHLYLMGRSQ